MSFEENEDMSKCSEIKLSSGINIIIGKNGSGKSNFLEILNRFVNDFLIYPIDYTETSIRSFKIKGGAPDFRNSIKLDSGRVWKVPKNHKAQSEHKKIQIEIGLTNQDKKNLVFILSNLDEINKFFASYASGYPYFPKINENDLLQQEKIILTFEDFLSYNKFVNVTNFVNDTDKFISFYIQNYNLLQNLIHLVNKMESKNWNDFKNIFTALSSYRNYNLFEPIFQVQSSAGDEIHSSRRDLGNQNLLHSEEKEPKVFRYIRNVLGYAFHDHSTMKGYGGGNPIMDFNNEVFKKLNTNLEKTIGLKIDIKRPDINSLTYRFDFIDTNTNQSLTFQELSAGQKGIVQLFLCVLGYDLENGVIIIDEPEIHMHPQMQDSFLEFILNLEADLHIQFVIATHSPQFVNSKTIAQVQKFYLHDGFTKIISPPLRNEDKDIIRYLDYFRGSKVLFADEVLMVEGDSDEYFYKFMFEKYKKTNSVSKSIEIIQIGGKDQYKEWNKFFNDWKIVTHFIRDRDNFGGTDDEIEKKYLDDIFILKKGLLEDYIGKVNSNKLSNVLDFCKNRYENWKNETGNKDKIDELTKIFDLIMS